MPNAKISLRAEQDELRARMRELGLGNDEIAAEFARRFRLRPRAAYRHAFGWTLKQAAEQINSYSGRAGVDPDGKAGMAASHLSEYKAWPARGGRKPTPRVLVLLANVYNTEIDHLLDLDDHDHLTPADRLLLSRSIRTGTGSSQADQAGWRPRDADVGDRQLVAGAMFPAETEVFPDEWDSPFQVSPLSWSVDTTKPLTPVAGSSGASRQPVVEEPILAVLAVAGRPVGADDIEALRDAVGRLVALDSVIGANDLASAALRLFRSVHRRITAGGYRPAVERDLYAVSAEIAEVAGWLLFDADRHDQARRLNHEAVFYARLAGDRSIEHLVIQNMCLQATHLQRPREGLLLTRTVLDNDRLSPRVAALFRSKEAHTLAVLGARSEALQAMEAARSQFLDGVSTNDPSWAWWVDERQFAGHEAACYAALGDWPSALRLRMQTVDHTPVAHVRDRYVSCALLVDTVTLAGAWSDAVHAIEEVLPYLDDVGSSRTAGWLRDSARRIERHTSHGPAREAAHHLGELIKTKA